MFGCVSCCKMFQLAQEILKQNNEHHTSPGNIILWMDRDKHTNVPASNCGSKSPRGIIPRMKTIASVSVMPPELPRFRSEIWPTLLRLVSVCVLEDMALTVRFPANDYLSDIYTACTASTSYSERDFHKSKIRLCSPYSKLRSPT